MAESKATIEGKESDGAEAYVLEEQWMDEGDEDEELEYFVDDDDDDDDDEQDLAEGDEEQDLDSALATLNAAKGKERSTTRKRRIAEGDKTIKTSLRPCVVDDFIRNFLKKRSLQKSLDTFNTEWYEMQRKGKLSAEDVGVVPDIYLRNQDLDEQVKMLRTEVRRLRGVAEKAKSTWDKFKKERDFHRMHHKRVVQEKGKLIVDIKRLKKHYSAYEPTLKELRNKYEIAMKEKMLMRLERDRQVRWGYLRRWFIEKAWGKRGRGKGARREGRDIFVPLPIFPGNQRLYDALRSLQNMQTPTTPRTPPPTSISNVHHTRQSPKPKTHPYATVGWEGGCVRSSD